LVKNSEAVLKKQLLLGTTNPAKVSIVRAALAPLPVDPRPNAGLGVSALIAALLIYLVSLAGHYLQVTALLRGASQAQPPIWTAVNIAALAAWLVFAGLGAVRHRSRHVPSVHHDRGA
jgi:hypothetical protein